MALEKEVILAIFLLKTFVEMAPLEIDHCKQNQYIMVDSQGNKQGCFYCTNCHEGSGLFPPCGTKITENEKNLIKCESCIAGSTYSDEYGPSRCKPCHYCAKKEIVTRKCTVTQDTICSGKCEKGYYLSNLTTYDCEKCSHCCNDYKDVRITDCKEVPDNRHCSMLREKECAPDGDVPTTTVTAPPIIKGRTPNPVETISNGLTTNEKIYIGIGTFAVIIMIVIAIGFLCFCYKQCRNQSSSPSTDHEMVTLECPTCNKINALQSLCLQVKPEGEIQHGQGVVIRCVLDINQQHLGFRWEKDGNEIKDGNTSTLNISSIDVTKFGNYTCEVICKERENCSSSKRGEILIVDSLLQCATCKYLSELQSLHLQVESEGETQQGRDVIIRCTLEDKGNKPDLEFSWEKDGKKIEGDNHEATLNLTKIDFKDFGNYSCVVKCKKTEQCSLSSSGNVFIDVFPSEGRSYQSISDLCRERSEVEEELTLALAPKNWKHFASDFVKMRKRLIDVLEANAKDGHKIQSAEETLQYLFAMSPEKTVYDLLKFVKKEIHEDEELVEFLCKEEYLTFPKRGESKNGQGDVTHVSHDEESSLKLEENEQNLQQTRKIVYCSRHSLGKMRIKESECLFCGIEMSLGVDSATLHKQKISDHVKNWGKERIAVQGDGHCILYAVSLCLKEVGYDGPCDDKSLLSQIRSEILDNLGFYKQFVATNDTDQLKKELDDYIQNKQYNSGVGDLIVPVLANITRTSVLVFHVLEEEVKSLLIYPSKEKPKRTIFLSKVGQHYDPVLHDGEIVDDNEDEKTEESQRQRRPEFIRSESTTSYHSSL